MITVTHFPCSSACRQMCSVNGWLNNFKIIFYENGYTLWFNDSSSQFWSHFEGERYVKWGYFYAAEYNNRPNLWEGLRIVITSNTKRKIPDHLHNCFEKADGPQRPPNGLRCERSQLRQHIWIQRPRTSQAFDGREQSPTWAQAQFAVSVPPCSCLSN